MYAARNITLCTKDCLCLFVCPTAATDTESGQIDKNLCIHGCRLCVDACPSHAIYLVLEDYPEPELKDPELESMMLSLLEQKCKEESIAESVSINSTNSGEKKLARALKLSSRILAEDCAREANFMLPQSRTVKDLLQKLEKEADSEIKEIIQGLL